MYLWVVISCFQRRPIWWFSGEDGYDEPPPDNHMMVADGIMHPFIFLFALFSQTSIQILLDLDRHLDYWRLSLILRKKVDLCGICWNWTTVSFDLNK